MASNDLMRLSGINSGYDTESMIQAMMTSYQTKIDTQQKKLTKLTWQQEAYRDVTSKLTAFKDKYFDVLNKGTYLMSPSSFTKYASKISTKSAGEAAKGVKVTTSTNSLESSYKLKVDKLATASTVKGAAMTPASFSLDLEKAADASVYSIGTPDANGKATRNYSFALDVQVGSVTRSVSFDVSATDTDGTIDMDEFKQNAVSALNTKLQEAFGFSGRTGAEATGQVDASGNEWYIQARTNSDGKLTFDVGGNATATVTEKLGAFGLATPAEKLAISAGSCVTGVNAVAVQVGDTTKSVAFMGVSSTYYDSKDDAGNEAIKAEFNALKAAAYRRENNLSANAAVSEADLKKFTYTNSRAAKDKNSQELVKALDTTFKDEGVTFSIENSYVTARGKDGKDVSFSMTSTAGGTLGLTKGTSTNKFTAKTKLEDMGIAANTDDGKYALKINGAEIKLDAGSTVDDLVNAVNKSSAGVTMTYSSLTNSLEITAKDMGTAGKIDIEASDMTDALGLTSGGSAVNYTQGENAIIEINGEKVYHNSNEYTVEGTTFAFDDEISLGETYNVDLSKSYDDIKQNIKDFVKDYNQLIDDIYGYTGTAPARDSKNNLYEPLTDAEKEEMDEKEIEKWETAAKKGILYNDTTVNTIMTKMRTALYGGTKMDNGQTFGLYAMGIKASSDYADHGKLEIDEDKLDKAFETYGEEITKLFTDPENGIMKKVSNVLDSAVKSTGAVKGTLIQRAGLEKGTSAKDNYLYRQMESIKKRINTLQDRYDSKEEYYWNVFTNLEKMMGTMNEQSTYMANYFGTGTYM